SIGWLATITRSTPPSRRLPVRSTLSSSWIGGHFGFGNGSSAGFRRNGFHILTRPHVTQKNLCDAGVSDGVRPDRWAPARIDSGWTAPRSGAPAATPPLWAFDLPPRPRTAAFHPTRAAHASAARAGGDRSPRRAPRPGRLGRPDPGPGAHPPGRIPDAVGRPLARPPATNCPPAPQPGTPRRGRGRPGPTRRRPARPRPRTPGTGRGATGPGRIGPGRPRPRTAAAGTPPASHPGGGSPAARRAGPCRTRGAARAAPTDAGTPPRRASSPAPGPRPPRPGT